MTLRDMMTTEELIETAEARYGQAAWYELAARRRWTDAADGEFIALALEQMDPTKDARTLPLETEVSIAFATDCIDPDKEVRALIASAARESDADRYQFWIGVYRIMLDILPRSIIPQPTPLPFFPLTVH